jgi:UDP:flavonoid glycosyltransferase YjiC (YdhE family)
MDTLPTLSVSTEARKRILFFAEAVTLSHVVRPIVLARALDPAMYEVRVACHPRYNRLFGGLPFPLQQIHSISSELFLDRISKGAPLWDIRTLRGYINEDLELIRDFAPDLIVGDWRLSLGISARLAKIPYVALNNAYWSPYAARSFPVPDHPAMKIVGAKIFETCFALVRPIAFAYHSLPLNRARREHGLPLLGFDLVTVYTDADHVLYVDVPELVPIPNLPDNHHYLGPILWSPAIPRPDWWERVPRDRPVIYVNLGSSGQQARLLPVILDALSSLPVTIVAATAGLTQLDHVPANALVADYLPGDEAAKRADLVICNGGSPTTQQALALGKPVLGVPGIMDQLLNMQGICMAGAGEMLRASQANAGNIRSCVTKMLRQSTYAEAAKGVGSIFAKYDAPGRFREIITQIIG